MIVNKYILKESKKMITENKSPDEEVRIPLTYAKSS